MNQRIVVGLDGTDYSLSAIKWACTRAKTFGGTVVGVAVLDVPDIEKTGLGAGVGGIYYAKRSIETKLENASAHTAEYLKQFKEVCEEAGVPHETHLKLGEPINVFKEEAKISDIIVMGLRTYFHSETSHEPDEGLIRALLVDPVCPIIGVPEVVAPHETILICFNGSASSARAMRHYARLSPNIPSSYKIVLLTITDSVEEGEYILARGEKYLNYYGIHPEKLWRTGKPEDVIFEEARKYDPTPLVVLGAYTDRAKYFFGRRTTKLMEDGTIPLFVYH